MSKESEYVNKRHNVSVMIYHYLTNIGVCTRYLAVSAAGLFIDDYSVQWKFVSNMFHAVKLFSDMGFNLIVPCIFLKYDENADFLKKCVTLLHSYSVLFVHVKCPVEELRRREMERGDRKIGDAEDMLSALVPKDIYDIEVDSYNLSKEECADKIIDRLNSPDKFTALNTLWSKMQP